MTWSQKILYSVSVVHWHKLNRSMRTTDDAGCGCTLGVFQQSMFESLLQKEGVPAATDVYHHDRDGIPR